VSVDTQVSCVECDQEITKQLVTEFHVVLPCCRVSPAGKLTALSSPTDAADPVYNTTKTLQVSECINRLFV